jgi:hypothetical protein
MDMAASTEQKLLMIFEEFIIPNPVNRKEKIKAKCKQCKAIISGMVTITSNFVKHVQVNDYHYNYSL